MARLSALQIYMAARQGGFSRDDAVTWTAIALAESGGNPRAHATRGEDSRGLWQINLDAHKNTWGDLYDPAVNARAAFEVSKRGSTIQPWSVTHARNAGTARDYRQYLDEAQAAAGSAPASGDGQVALAAAAGGGQGGGPGADVQSLAFSGVDAQGPVCQPISGGRLSDTFGAARSGGRKHEGIDIFAPQGTPIHAVASGTVVQGFTNSLGGVVVRIQGDDGRYYYYAHLKPGSQSHLQVGQHVNAGQVIGGVGNTGDAATTPTHLHLQVREGQNWINPFGFLQGLPDIEDVAGGQVGAPADPFAIDAGAPPSVADTDHDGLTDQFEAIFGTRPDVADTDADGLSDAYETATSHTDPLSADTDADGVGDAYEVAHGTDPGRAVIPEAARAAGFGGLATVDSDSDGLSDAYEARIRTDPLVADTDADGLSDGFEAAHGSNPLLVDSDSDGLTDGFEAGAGTLEPAGVPGAAPADATTDPTDPLQDLLQDPLLDAPGGGNVP